MLKSPLKHIDVRTVVHKIKCALNFFPVKLIIPYLIKISNLLIREGKKLDFFDESSENV